MPTPTASMSGLFLRPRHARKARIAVCQFCKAGDKVSYSTSLKQRSFPGSSLSHDTNGTLSRSNNKTRYWNSRSSSVTILGPSRKLSSTTPNVEAAVTEIQEKFEAIRRSKKAAPEEEVIALLQQCLHVVETWTKDQHPHDSAQNPTPTGTPTTAASSLLDLNEKRVGFNHLKESKTTQSRIVDTISNLSTELLEDERVFISPAALEIYTKIHLLIKRADYFHLIFSLYAQKPIPIANTDPVQFRPPSPNSVKNAVPSKLANEALGIALEQKNLSLALAIIDATFCMPAFTRAKLLKNAAVPLAGLATAPLASYAVATWAASLQNTMDASMATGITFTATLAYIGFTSSVGVIAVATSNDQMERVSWASGIPLRQRWLREEERGALDKVAMAWGFKDPYRRGEEEGEEWENLREFIGMRGMILDKTELMEGMQ